MSGHVPTFADEQAAGFGNAALNYEGVLTEAEIKYQEAMRKLGCLEID